MCSLFHQSVRTLAEDFKRDLGRHYYATPTSYLELIKTYKQLLASKRQQVGTSRTPACVSLMTECHWVRWTLLWCL